MRQLGDLLVWCAMVVVVASLIYFTPRLVRQVSDPAPLTHTSQVHDPGGSVHFRATR